MRRCLLLIVVALLLFAGVARAQPEANKNPHGELKWDCQECHTPDGWRRLKDPMGFSHKETAFPLKGAHQRATCGGCHKELVFAQTKTVCAECHSDPHRSQLGTDCQACHSSNDWQNHRDMFDLHAGEGFPLTGAHSIVDCDACHLERPNGDYAEVASDCRSCHQSDFDHTANPNHAEAAFPTDCETCHPKTGVTWSVTTWQHPVLSLRGAHEAIGCYDCHTGGFAGTTQDCYSCHETEYAEAVDPNHIADNFGQDCTQCHTEFNWAPATMDHELTGFPLTGAHMAVVCADCHITGYTGTASECLACHERDYTTALDPVHDQDRFPHTCQTCHSTDAWEPASIDHERTNFPLTGAHVTTDCGSCHTNGYTGTPQDCYACHEGNFSGTVEPSHVQANFDHDCTICHSTTGWKPVTWDHDNTQFPLTGAHTSTECASCHSAGYAGTPIGCYACHESNYTETDDPNHVLSGFDHDCTNCHTTGNWDTEVIDHSSTRFPLTGAHLAVTCNNCHTTGYAGTPVECVACHTIDLAAGVDPNHSGAGFPADCNECHTTDAWLPSSFNHTTTSYELTGAHQSVTCSNCHSAGFTGTTRECGVCHETHYLTAVDPNHVEAGFPRQCDLCHSTDAWKSAIFDHNLTSFPLTGAHVAVECNTCHTSGYSGTASDCYSCHNTDYTTAADPNHALAGYDHDCTGCHTTNAWQPASVDHDLTNFPLTGAHQAVDCGSCHTAGYTGTTSDCYSCHNADYTTVAEPNHVLADFDHDCTVCHTTTAWTPADWDHGQTQFPLTGAHQSVTCGDCHSAGYAGTAMECVVCHEGNFLGAVDPNHIEAGFPRQCDLCHSTDAWESAILNHDLTTFPLTGAHQAVDCNSCHTAGYTGTASDCFSCHNDNYAGVTDPNHALGGYDHDCTNCHTTTGWLPADMDHNLTGFPLTGAHQTVDCGNCHTSGFTGTATDCYACHTTDYTEGSNPDHVLANFDHDCTVCHTTTAWDPANWDHGQTRFALTGAHQSVTCNSCHSTGYSGTSMDCVACHENNFLNANDPNHLEAGFPQQCALCHSTSAWEPADLNHDLTGFPLTGAHQAVDCNSCHTDGYSGTASDCYACHSNDYAGVNDPNHVQANFDHNCTACHTTAAWEPANWDHNQTSFALTGAHQAVTCNSCHSSGYTGTSSACDACHGDDYARTSNPRHTAAGFSVDCRQCHATTRWDQSAWNHGSTGYTLTGAHQSTTCVNCHATAYAGTSTDCYVCHQSDYNATRQPDHLASGFPTICGTCHTTSAWTPADWDHNQTQFPLTGAHQAVNCNSCHASGYTGTPLECYACHSTDYTGTTDPNHVASSFPTTCATCHTTSAWTPADWDHNQTQFPLLGAHQAVACNQCHASGYTGTPTDCYACHQTDFTSVADPNHVASGFSHSCLQCHSMNAWQPAAIDHNQTLFPLTGAHRTVNCIDCHSTSYSGTPTTCIACHESAYLSTSDPNHAAAGFPTTCLDCHTTSAWSPANWNHDGQYFPIYSGAHSGRWSACGDCHLNPSDYSTFECIFCHEHNKSSTDDDHREVNNYQYLSTRCLSCHPDGRH